jgi:hypothetical protein
MSTICRETSGLYRELLGSDYERLSPALRAFHDRPTASCAGTGCVTRAPGWINNCLATLLGLPPSIRRTRVRLEVCRQAAGERWGRSFGRHRLDTIQRRGRGLLLERAGPITFGLRVCVRGGGLTFRTRRTWLLGIPCPQAFSPTVDADVTPRNFGWNVCVRIGLAWRGQILEYEVEVTP